MIADEDGRGITPLSHHRQSVPSAGDPEVVHPTTSAVADHYDTPAYRRGVALAVATERIEVLDFATIGPCPRCGTPTRRMPSVPIAGSALDTRAADRAHCAPCLQAGVVAAIVGAGLR